MRPAIPELQPPSRRFLAALLVFVVLAAQALGLVHRTVHGPAGSGPGVALHVHGPADAHEEAGWLAALFDGHDDESKCRLFDSLTQGGPQPACVNVLPPPQAAGLLATLAGAVLARWAALFDARGPPRLR